MRIIKSGKIREYLWPFFLFLAICLSAQANDFRVSAVQENQVRLEGGLLDGLEEGLQGEIFYTITVSGQPKSIVPAKITLNKVEDRQSIGLLKEQTGTVNIGYSASFALRFPSDLLTKLQARAAEVFARKDFDLAKQFYHKILASLPDDAFAKQKIKECDAQIEKRVLLQIETQKVPYYKQVITTLMAVKNEESVRLVLDYVDKILAVAPGDQAALEYKKWASSGAPPLRKDMVLIPESDAPIGSDLGKTPFANETPRQTIHVPAFYIDKYEVTNAEYKRFCDATGHSYPEYFVNGNYPEGKRRRPVVMVSWNDAEAYARWAGKRLPGEYEWEAAAAGTSAHTWPWGDTWDLSVANTLEAGAGEGMDAGSLTGDRSAYGVYDMAGNVSEWTADRYQLYPGNPSIEDLDNQFKAVRGGSFQKSKEFARCQFRARQPENSKSLNLGFRCAASK
jgi:formylglycine-generating enzyme required for sulfatase activity